VLFGHSGGWRGRVGRKGGREGRGEKMARKRRDLVHNGREEWRIRGGRSGDGRKERAAGGGSR